MEFIKDIYFEKNGVFRKSPPGEGGFEEGDAPFRGLRGAVGVGAVHNLCRISPTSFIRTTSKLYQTFI